MGVSLAFSKQEAGGRIHRKIIIAQFFKNVILTLHEILFYNYDSGFFSLENIKELEVLSYFSVEKTLLTIRNLKVTTPQIQELHFLLN